MKIAFFPDFAGRNGEVNVRYRVELSEAERAELKGLVSGGKQAVRRLKRAQILLASDVGQTEEAIARTLRIGISTVYRTRRRFVEGNLEGALSGGASHGGGAQAVGKAGGIAGGDSVFQSPCGVRALDAEVTGGTDGGVDRAYDAVARDDPPQAARERIEALAAQDVVHCESGWRVRGADGGCAGFIRGEARCAASGGQF
jgi:hypothetical protein